MAAFFQSQAMPASEGIPPCPNCNLVLISIDTLRADRVGVINSKSRVTPNLDRLAKSAYVYRHAYAQAPWTLPSHRSVFYGLHPWKMPVLAADDSGFKSLANLTESLSRSGFATAGITTGAFINQQTGFARGFTQFIEGESGHDAPFITRVTKRWLNQRAKAKFFLFIHTFHVHEPFAPEKSDLKSLDPAYEGPFYDVDFGTLAAIASGQLKAKPRELRRIPVLYDAEVLEIDRALGGIFAEFKRLKLDKNTLFIVFSDHGEDFNERGDNTYGMHGFSLYEEQIHIPLIVKHPYVTKRRDLLSPVEATDIFATLLSVAGIELPKKLDSHPLPASDTPTSMARPVFAMTSMTRSGFLAGRGVSSDVLKPAKNKEEERNPQRTIIALGKKLITFGKNESEFYDLTHDPHEKNNSLGKLPETEGKLKALMANEF